MIRSLLILVVAGMIGLAVVGVVFSMLVPLLMIALKVAVVLAVGYVILKLVRPDLAEECRARLER